MDWQAVDDIAIALYDAHPDVDPLAVRFQQLLDWIIQLDDFDGVRAESSEKRLEAIQMAWLEEYRFQTGD